MPGLTALNLARTQFAFTIAFHIIFPALTIGLASYLAVLEVCWLRHRQAIYLELYQFWSKVFTLNFVMGVVFGIVMAYQFDDPSGATTLTYWIHSPYQHDEIISCGTIKSACSVAFPVVWSHQFVSDYPSNLVDCEDFV